MVAVIGASPPNATRIAENNRKISLVNMNQKIIYLARFMPRWFGSANGELSRNLEPEDIRATPIRFTGDKRGSPRSILLAESGA